jgi:DNA-binding NtrC family response regulator
MRGKAKLLIMDDDEIYGTLLRAKALQRGIDATYAPSLVDLGSIGFLKDYDVGVIDFYLEGMRGNEIAEYVEKLLIDIPVIIVSGDANLATHIGQWPKSIFGFVSKAEGVDRVLEKVCRALDQKTHHAS